MFVKVPKYDNRSFALSCIAEVNCLKLLHQKVFVPLALSRFAVKAKRSKGMKNAGHGLNPACRYWCHASDWHSMEYLLLQ